MSIIQSTAKINLFLDVLGKDPSDGYHYIDSLFQEVSLHDEIEIIESGETSDNIAFENADVTGISTIHKALDLFRQKFNNRERFHITVRKNIPIGAGLGGGSSNAASVLLYLAGRYNIPKDQILDIGRKVGSDVPFFFYGGLCHVSGKGEVVEPLQNKIQGVTFLIVYPNIHVSTKWAYSLFDSYEKRNSTEYFWNTPVFDIDFLEKIVYNKFQIFVLKNNDALKMAAESLEKVLGSRFSFMSGSGSSLVFVYDDRERAQKDLEFLNREFHYRQFLCDPFYR